jgi:hypothetical protein
MLKHLNFRYRTIFICVAIQFLLMSSLLISNATSEENASNPLAKVKNTDVRYQYLDLDNARINDVFLDGAFMALDNLKIKYEVHYWETDISGDSENNIESATLKGIYFPTEGAWGDVTYRVALGLDWIVDLGEVDKVIGSGSDQLGPFVGLAMGIGGITLIPLVQHFFDYSGEDVNTTAFRLIAIKPLPQQMWLKLDAKVPIDWENDQEIPAVAELQFGKSINKIVGVYVDGLVGIGTDRPYDWGVGLGVRFNY